ncbi:MAG: amidase [Actinobacteria bacterium]|nr:amidase [Actinomycetota bacterium]
MSQELAFLPATRQAELIKAGELSPVELTELYLSRIEKLDGELNAFVTVTAEGALADAARKEKQVAAGEDLPSFHGVPIPIKELDDVAGVRTTYSSRSFESHVPETDAATVTRLRGAGFVLLGKSNSPEFGTIPMTESDLNGVCRNPWDVTRTPGGSSGGAGAAVASGMAPAAHGSDGGGSIRIPASCCGLFGLKPSRGRISQAPGGEGWAGFSTQGALTRTVRDSAAILDVLSGYETGDPYWAPPPDRPFVDEVGAQVGRLRIGFTTASPTGSPIEPEPLAAVEDAVVLLEELGHQVTEVEPEWADPELVPMFITVVQTSSAYHDGTDPEKLEPLNRMLAEAAMATSSLDYIKALEGLKAQSRRVVALWNDYDVIVTPTLAMVPPKTGWIRDQEDPFMQLALAGAFIPFTPGPNITGQPAASIPLHWTDEGLPVGVQLIGPPVGDALLLRLSAQLEEAKPWSERRPPIS